MWKPSVNFITLHYAWILSMALLGFIVIGPRRNIAAIDAFFFGASAATESGLNTVDVKDLEIYQQLYIYFIPIITNLGFINIAVVVVRLHWFRRRLKDIASSRLRPSSATTAAITNDRETDIEANTDSPASVAQSESEPTAHGRVPISISANRKGAVTNDEADNDDVREQDSDSRHNNNNLDNVQGPSSISFPADLEKPTRESRVLYIPPPRERNKGQPIVERDAAVSDDGDDDEGDATKSADIINGNGVTRRRPYRREGASVPPAARSVEQVASSIFVLGRSPTQERRRSEASQRVPPRLSELPTLSRGVTVGRNARFYNLTARDREELGGVEYRALKLLLVITPAYFFGLHLFGVICLLPWIHNAPSVYTDYLEECGQDKTWWAFYSAQTMVDNLGFTLTPDSMISFRDATWPMLVLTFLAFAGNTLYPIFLRLLIWVLFKFAPGQSSLKASLKFLLDYPRRCYTLLFPSRVTWVLFVILVVLNFVDVVLILVLDLENPEVNTLALGPRILAALFQAASARHTGTASFNLANVSPAVQFSLLVMMYIAVLPIAISIRASNTYEERTVGLYSPAHNLDEYEGDSRSYLVMHLRNQLSFDLWYLFLGTFLICIAEADKIADINNPAFAVFPIFFEVVSGYANVGLSLGHPSVLTSLSGQFTVFSKVVVCAMMLRGRHRGLPYALDRAIMLPDERLTEDGGRVDA
ncbi:potassium transporter [Durotheca rogersii]|uniref:potassium transporter n=1 Tax=Durotheca rogersii TaxID=419775 RepID=UPI00221E41CF|nr:potassium transporter [Durotheca rogersii]KAI5861696.1 potassium transporter [Durotheca rogersii]